MTEGRLFREQNLARGCFFGFDPFNPFLIGGSLPLRSLRFPDRPHQPGAAGQLCEQTRRAQAEMVDPLMASDLGKEGDGGGGEPMDHGIARSREGRNS
jgi:hypothetical protein